MKKKTDSHAEQLISLREFARRMAVTEKTIRDAIVKSKIVEGVFYKEGKPKIRFEIAKKEFEVLGVGYRSYLKNDDAPINSVNEQEKEDYIDAWIEKNTGRRESYRLKELVWVDRK